MAQETAVSWLVNELPQVDWSDPHWVAKLEQAKAMEKEQIKKAYYTDAVSRPLGLLTRLTPVLKTFENYYESNYGNKE